MKKEIHDIEPTVHISLPIEKWKKKFSELRPDYEKLCDEIAYILKKRIEEKKIEVSSIISRAKTLNSFLEKIERKYYKDCFKEITDFAGVRVVCLYLDDLKLIEEIINEEFEVIEKVDKLSEKEPDEFGYGAIHYIVKLGNKSSGARYDDLKGMKCEVQVRTVLQDAWAIIDHHLVYKNESAVPKTLQRKLNSLSGLFETADDQFQQLRNDREKYIETIRDSTKTPKDFLKTKLNIDSLSEYLLWKFKYIDIIPEELDPTLKLLRKNNYSTLLDIENKYQKISENTDEINNKVRKYFINEYEIKPYSYILLWFLLAIVDIKFKETLMRFLRHSDKNFLTDLCKEFEPK